MQKLYFKKSWLWFLSLALSILTNFLTVRITVCKGALLDSALSGRLSSETLSPLCLLLLLAALSSFLANVLRQSWSARSVQHLRNEFFASLVQRPAKSFRGLPEGEILAKYTQQIGQLEKEFYGPLGLFAKMLIQLAAVSVALFRLSVPLALLAIFCCSLSFLAPKLMDRKVSEAADQRRLAFEAHAEKFTSWLSCFEIIRNYRIEHAILGLCDESLEEYGQADWNFARLKSKSGGFGFLVSLGAQSVLLFACARKVLKGEISAGLFYSIIALVDSLGPTLYWLSKRWQDVIATRPLRESLEAFILDGEKKKDGTRVPREEAGSIVFDKVTAGYAEKTLLKEASLRLEGPGAVLLQGPSGCGKSSAVRLILGIEEPQSGSVRIGGTESSRIQNRPELVTVAAQEAQLLDASLRDNLTLGAEIPDEKIFRALEATGLGRLANAEALERESGENGAGLSGGEKKRLSLARALLRDTPVLILDEPLANVDPGNVSRIEDLIFEQKDRLVLVISHGFSEEKLCRFKDIVDFKDGGLVRREGAFHAS